MKRKYISAVIFWGAIWGLEEATLGHLLHITSLNLGWFIWFPLSYFFMSMVYKQTGRLNSIIFSSLIAAAIKFVNLFMTVKLVVVICPAMSIILEGISLYAVLKLVDWKKYVPIFQVVSVSLLWRILFLAGLLFIPGWIMSYPYKNVSSILKFILYEGLINSIFICGVIILIDKANKINEGKSTCFKLFIKKLSESRFLKDIIFKPPVSLGILAAALFIQWIL